MTPRPWTPEELVTLRRLYSITRDMEEIAKATAHSKRACYNCAHKLGLRKLLIKKPDVPPPRPEVSRRPTRAGPGPAYLPGPPIETADTKYTYGPGPAAPTRTNTFSE